MDIAIATKEREKTCGNCGEEFVTYYAFQKYCSSLCVRKAMKKNSIAKRKNAERRNFLKFDKMRLPIHCKVWLKCKQCLKKYERYSSQVKFRGSKYCSMKCKRKAMLAKRPTIKVLDEVWRDIVKLRVGGKCEFCHKDKYINSHHIYSRTNYATRWDLDNGIALCAMHHMLGNFSAHKSPMEFSEWIATYKGKDWLTKIKQRAKSPYKKTNYEEVLRLLQSQKQELLEIYTKVYKVAL